MNTGADKFGIIGNYVDTTGKTFKKSQSIEPPKRRQEGKSADYEFSPVYDSNVCVSRQMQTYRPGRKACVTSGRAFEFRDG